MKLNFGNNNHLTLTQSFSGIVFISSTAFRFTSFLISSALSSSIVADSRSSNLSSISLIDSDVLNIYFILFCLYGTFMHLSSAVNITFELMSISRSISSTALRRFTLTLLKSPKPESSERTVNDLVTIEESGNSSKKTK